MRKKTDKKNNLASGPGPVRIIAACVCWGMVGGFFPVQAQESLPVLDIRKTLESIIDPFLSKIPAEYLVVPAPEPVVPVRPAEGKDLPFPDPLAVDPGSVVPAAEPEVEKVPPSLTLAGKIYNTPQPMALVNGTVALEGDTVDGAVVRRISSEGVELEWEGEILRLSIDPLPDAVVPADGAPPRAGN